MARPRGLTLATLIFLSFASPGDAQTPFTENGSAITNSRESVAPIQPYGGFGLENMRTPIAGREWVDRFGMVHTAEPAPLSTVLAPHRVAKKVSSSPVNRKVSRTPSLLTTGSLNWPASSELILYSPEFRYRSYGGGYGYGPYGSVDCGIMYKGMSLGY
jgi:hypothetical protein